MHQVFRGREIYEQQLALSDLTMRMRKIGVRIDRAAVEEHRKHLETTLASYVQAFERLVPFKHVVRGKTLKTRSHVYIGPYRLGAIGSHSDLRRLFFGRFGLIPTSYTEEGQPCLDDDALLSIAQAQSLPGEAARQILSYREKATLKSRYVDGLPIFDDGRLHAEWKSWGTKTLRWASKGPNMQNLPEIMRNMLIADEGKFFVKTDMSSLELIIMGLLSGDEQIIEWYNRGLSGYLETAKVVYKCPTMTKHDKRYKLFKSVILGLNYGAGAETVWRLMLPKSPGIKLQEIKQIIDTWFSARHRVYDWRVQHLKECQQRKYVEAELSGLRQYFYDDDIDPTKALNFPMQANGAKIVNDATLELDAALDWSTEQLLLSVHDELVTQGPDPKHLVALQRKAMERTITLGGRTITLKTESGFGTNYRDMKPIA